MLRALHRFLGTGMPVIGVNFGRVGFLTSIAADELEAGLARVVRRRATSVVELPTLEVEVGGERSSRSTTSSRRARRSAGWSSSTGRSAARTSAGSPATGDLRDAVRLDGVQPLERRPGARLGARRDGGHVRRAALAARAAARRPARPRRRRSGTGRPTWRPPCSSTATASASSRPDGRVASGSAPQRSLLATLPEATFFRRLPRDLRRPLAPRSEWPLGTVRRLGLPSARPCCAGSASRTSSSSARRSSSSRPG